MSTPPPDDQTHRLARLGDAMDAFLAWQGSGGQEPEAFLAAHEPLRDLLAPMLSDAAAAPDEASAPVVCAPGQWFGDYRLIREVGRGGMGVVWEAEQGSLRRRVALKILHEHLTWSPTAIERFRREAAVVAGLQHSAIVPIHDVGEWRGRHWFTMAFVEGRPLSELLDARRLGVRADCSRAAEAAELIARVADALQHAHEHGLVHRDVKPHNILVGSDGAVRLVDFGLAKNRDAVFESATGEFVGTPHYCSPEQARGEEVGPPGDVFSLGIVLYELLAGRRPFVGDSARLVLRQIELGLFEPLDRIARHAPRDLRVICGKSMELAPGDRYASAGAMAADLRRFLRIEPILARPPGPLLRVGKWMRRHPLRVAVWVLGILVGIGAPSAWALHQQRTAAILRVEGQRLDEAERLAFDGLERTVALLLEQLDRQPGFDGRKQANIDAVVRTCEAFVAARADEPARQVRAARVFYELADIERRLGHAEAGLRLCERALAVVASCDSGDGAVAELRARALRRQLALRQHLDPSGGAEEFERAIGAWEPLADAPDARTEIVVELADTLLVRARALAMQPRRRVEAERLLLRAAAWLTPAHRQASRSAELMGLRLDNALGHVRLWTGRHQEALATLQAVQVRLAARPLDQVQGVENALALAAIGEAQQKLGRATEAEAALQAAIDVLQAAVVEFPGLATVQRALLNTRVRLATVQLAQRKVEAAETLLRAAAASVPATPPAVGPATWMDRTMLADLHIQLASCILLRCANGGDCNEARQLLHSGCALLEELIREQPEQLDLQVDLGGAWNNLAAMCNEHGDPHEAAQFAERAIACQQGVLAEAPETRRARLFLGMHHGQLALALAAIGQPAAATTAAREATRLATRHAPTLRLAAEAATRAANAVAADGSLPAAEREQASDACAGVAVAALARIGEVNRAEASRLLRDERFAALRGRADFAALLQQVQR
ncbi:MAG: serine/threonine protein kinase [Planctomycetes bacterium]|nr:serine/threonine protein kinase [Planctomycetota bacterium]